MPEKEGSENQPPADLYELAKEDERRKKAADELRELRAKRVELTKIARLINEIRIKIYEQSRRPA